MENATCRSRRFREMGRLLSHLVHGALLTAGLFALAIPLASYLEHGTVAAGPGGETVLAAADAAQAHAELELGTQEGRQPASGQRLSTEMAKVKSYVASRYRVSQVALEPLLAEAEKTGRRLGLDPLLLVAMIAIESSFNPFAESSVGAQGLMQVIPRFHKDKIGEDAGEDALFDPQLNIRVGALVLKEGLSRFGTLTSALQYYGGALSDPNAGYANKVLSMKARLRQAAGRSNA